MLKFDRNYEVASLAGLSEQETSIACHTFAGLTPSSCLWLVSGLNYQNARNEVPSDLLMFVRLEDALELTAERGYEYHELSLLDYSKPEMGRIKFYGNMRFVRSVDVTSHGDAHECGVEILSNEGDLHMTRTRLRRHGSMIPKMLWWRPAL